MRLLVFIWTLAIPVCAYSQMEKVYILDGNEAYALGNFEEADSLYELALKLDSGSVEALYNKSLAQYKILNFEEALIGFSNLIDISTDTLLSNSYYNKANCELMIWFSEDFHLSSIEEEIEDNEENKNDPIEVKMEKYLAMDSLLTLQANLLESSKKRLLRSIEGYKNSLRIDPDNEDARYNLMYAKELLSPEEKKEESTESEEKNKGKESKESEFATKRMAEVRKLIEANEFVKAYYLLAEGMQIDPQLSGQNELLSKLEIIKDILAE